MAIDFTLTEEQKALQEAAHGFAESVLRPVAEKIDRAPTAWDAFTAGREAFREMAHAGLTKSYLPTGYGGDGSTMVDMAIAAEELVRVDNNVPGALIGTALALQPVIRFGTAEQQERFLRPFANDDEGDLLASFAFTDVGGGANFDASDPEAGIRTFARRDGDEWVITGQKHYSANGSGWDGTGAHLYTVVCRVDPTRGPDESLAVIAVPGNCAGISVVDIYDKLGQRGVVTPRVHFDEVRVPANNLIGEPGRKARAIIDTTFAWSAALLGAACVGTMRGAFEYALDFARREKRLGTVPVIDHQNVGFTLANIKMTIEACRYLAWKACHDYEMSAGRAQELAVSTKVYCSEAAADAVYRCMRVVGIASYTRDLAPLERYLRDVVGFPLLDGSNDGVRRRQLQDMLRDPAYSPMRAARGEVPPWEA